MVKRSYIPFLISNYVCGRRSKASNIIITTLCRGNGRRFMNSISPSNCQSPLPPAWLRLFSYTSSLHSSVGSDDHETKFAGEKFGLVDSTEGALGEHSSREVGGWGEVLEFHDPHP